MKYAIVKNNAVQAEITDAPYLFSASNPYVYQKPSTLKTAQAQAFGVLPVEEIHPAPVEFMEESGFTYEVQANKVVKTYTLVDMAQDAIIESFKGSVQAVLDEEAQAHGYDGIMSACSYAGAANVYQAEAQAFITWRADCWSTCYSIMDEVIAGNQARPTTAELLAALPTYVAP